MRVVFNDGNFRLTPNGKVYKRGEPFVISKDALRRLMAAGFSFTALDDGDELPESDTMNLPATRQVAVEPGPVVTEAEASDVDDA